MVPSPDHAPSPVPDPRHAPDQREGVGAIGRQDPAGGYRRQSTATGARWRGPQPDRQDAYASTWASRSTPGPVGEMHRMGHGRQGRRAPARGGWRGKRHASGGGRWKTRGRQRAGRVRAVRGTPSIRRLSHCIEAAATAAASEETAVVRAVLTACALFPVDDRRFAVLLRLAALLGGLIPLKSPTTCRSRNSRLRVRSSVSAAFSTPLRVVLGGRPEVRVSMIDSSPLVRIRSPGTVPLRVDCCAVHGVASQLRTLRSPR